MGRGVFATCKEGDHGTTEHQHQNAARAHVDDGHDHGNPCALCSDIRLSGAHVSTHDAGHGNTKTDRRHERKVHVAKRGPTSAQRNVTKSTDQDAHEDGPRDDLAALLHGRRNSKAQQITDCVAIESPGTPNAKLLVHPAAEKDC